MKEELSQRNIYILIILLVTVSFICSCSCSKMNRVALCDNYSVSIPARHFKKPEIQVPRLLEIPQGVVYTYYANGKDTFDFGCGVVISNYYNAMAAFLPDSIEYWPDNFGRSCVTLSDTLLYNGYTTLTQDIGNKQKVNKKRFWKVMIVRNPIIESGTGCYMVGYFGIPRSRKKVYESLFSINPYKESNTLHRKEEPLFDSLVIQKWYHTIF